MLTIVQRGGATREKPPEVVRGAASRLPWAWDGLCFGVPFNDSTRDAARDLVWGAPPATVNGLTWTRDNRGNAAANLADTHYVQYPDNPTHSKPSTQITIYVRLRRVGTFPNAWGGVLTKRYDSGISPYISWGIYGGAAGDTLSTQVSVNGAQYETHSTYVLPTTDWISAFTRWRSGAAERLDVLGERGEVRDSVTNASTATGTIPYLTGAGAPLSFNTTENDVTNAWADYSQGMVWSRYLTDQEIQALVADPYGWYSPRRETIGLSSPYPLVAAQSFVRQVSSG